MDKPNPVELISEEELRAATGVDRHSLRRIRNWLHLKPTRVFRGRGAGSESYYPQTAVPMIRRFCDLRRGTRKIDACVWQLWIEGHAVDIRQWADERLALLQAKLAGVSNIDQLREAIGTLSLAQASRTDARRPLRSRLYQTEEISLFLLALNVAAGRVPEKSLYDPGSPALAALHKAGGIPEEWGPPDRELEIESISISRLREMLLGASAEEIEQARQDWAMIAGLIETALEIDWFGIRKILRFLQSTSSKQPPAPTDFLSALWRNPDARAVLLAGLIHVRRSPEHSARFSEILAGAELLLARFPRRKSGEAA